ncbi:Flagellar motor switch protein FliN [Salipiger mucosus DSM 16094]|uniref:Flagellar motor switch protein FliN n=1 Tax=Salipiger mucosus DSM 16094 TaxID=1123237 RepID=S9QT25_9RHOB|nr:Flagellar motor switch protein FliN [Salipiger mucosus DSM 16094]
MTARTPRARRPPRGPPRPSPRCRSTSRSRSGGRARWCGDLLRLAEGSVLTLDKKLDDPVELYVGDRLIGMGALEVVEGGEGGLLAVRITEVADLKSPT